MEERPVQVWTYNVLLTEGCTLQSVEERSRGERPQSIGMTLRIESSPT